MKAQIVVRKARKTDIPAIVELWKELMDFHSERDRIYVVSEDAQEHYAKYISDRMSQENACVLVAEIDHLLVGHCLALVETYPPVFTMEQYGTIEGMIVSEKHRHCGIGEAMVHNIREWFRAKKMKRLEVRVSIFNEISTVFWRKMGFSPFLETLCCEI